MKLLGFAIPIVCSLSLLTTEARAQSLIYQFDGESILSGWGRSTDAGRDVNGDGFPDLIVGGENGAQSSRGLVKVFDGATGAVLHRMEGANSWDVIGRRVALLDDLDGDQAAEFAHYYPNGPIVYSGMDGTTLFHLSGVYGSFQLESFGDWNQDGTPDVIADGRVYSGVDGAQMFDFQIDFWTTVVPGDLDGDGQLDLLTRETNPREFVARSGVDGHVLYRRWNQFTLVPLGFAGVGDVDGDGRDDFGVLRDLWYRIDVHSGADGDILYTRFFAQEPTGPLVFRDLPETTGDLDGDGHDDFIVGGPSAIVISGATGSEITRMPTDVAGAAPTISFAGDVQGDGIPDLIVGDTLASGSFGSAVVYDIHETALGVAYCRANPNSRNYVAHMFAVGSPSIADNDLTLSAGPVPADSFIMFYGPGRTEVPFGNGWRCVGGGIQRLSPPGVATGRIAERRVDLAAEGIQPGTLNFQFWMRDPMGGGAGFNTSDGYSITFVP